MPDAAAHRDVVAHDARSRKYPKPGDYAIAADADVMGDLHEIVDLGALADDRIGHGAAIDGGVGADLDIVLDDDPADLRHRGGPLAPPTKPKPSWPILAPPWMMTRLPISAYWMLAPGPT